MTSRVAAVTGTAVSCTAAGCAAALVAWNNLVLPAMDLGPRGRAAANAGFGVALAAATRAAGVSATELGWRGAGKGLRWGTASVVLPVAAYTVMLAVSPVRRRMAAGARRADHTEWVFVHIPFGTVLAEELLFRSVLYALTRRESRRWHRVLTSVAFGLWHVAPARHAGDSVPGTVALTALSGVVFDELRRRTGSVVAPMLLHLAINAGGAVAVGIATRLRTSERDARR
ncbi:CPBP family intramembrane glutamic endopeptidase [Rhodococcus sp. Chr-9]|uniref:CPBP family intramembrane glutamic endopeptidase n=1 Tax=Rhodococcus sp. Chr-9 TaxID=713612 RepID=UPI00068D400D|nr:CPBP family intramembrane glutamic endopeptidase [Rhodococcus sp. Chr-9]